MKNREKRQQHQKQRHSMFALLLVCFISMGKLPVFAQEQRGLLTNIMNVSDAQGNPVLLYKESHALVLGISNYTNGWPALPGVRRDVEDVKAALEAQGFNVVVEMDLDKIGLDGAFSDFISRYGQEPENRLLFYFAGHGHTVKTSYGEELGYIVPVDAPNPNEDVSTFQSKAMEMQQIEIYARRIQAKHALFLFDACFSGSLFALSRAVPEAINYKTSLPVRQFITSGSADETVPDESIFRAQFVRALQGDADTNEDGYLTGTELGEFLQVSVVNYSYNSQHPQYGKIRNPNLDKGDFVFQVRAAVPVDSPSPDEPPDITASFNDIQAQLKWQKYLDQMEETSDTLQQYEQLDVDTAAKITGWERFLQTFAPNNPYSSRDEELRKLVDEHINALKQGRPSTPVSTRPPATPTEVAQEFRTSVEPFTGMNLVWIEGGCFDMGSPEGEIGRNSGEGPVHEVCVEGFWMGQYEVTQQQWQQIIGTNPAYWISQKVGKNSGNYPVENVSWKDVEKFLQKLNQNTAGASFRLPSEAEWEYAVRAGTRTAYSFGNDAAILGEYAWYGENSGRMTHAVGQLQPNAWGLYDMHGNVWEWVADPGHDNYQGAPADGRVWTTKGDASLRMLRGGSWGSHPIALRSANRLRNKPDYTNNSIGFRVVRTF